MSPCLRRLTPGRALREASSGGDGRRRVLVFTREGALLLIQRLGETASTVPTRVRFLRWEEGHDVPQRGVAELAEVALSSPFELWGQLA
jgi:hypothetical protein